MDITLKISLSHRTAGDFAIDDVVEVLRDEVESLEVESDDETFQIVGTEVIAIEE